MEGRSIIAIAAAAVAPVIGSSSAAERNAAGDITTAGAVDVFEVLSDASNSDSASQTVSCRRRGSSVRCN